MLVIVDYGLGNLGAIANMLLRLGVGAQISAVPEVISGATKLVLPGVGAFDAGARQIRERGLATVLQRKVILEKTPCLGICLGAQLTMTTSEEGGEIGLGWFPGRVVRFGAYQVDMGLKVPHMGWAEIKSSASSRLFSGMPSDPRFYFCHSYYLLPDNPQQVVATAVYGQPFAAALERDNLLAVQFHPEKSHKFGMQMLKNFVELY